MRFRIIEKILYLQEFSLEESIFFSTIHPYEYRIIFEESLKNLQQWYEGTEFSESFS